MTPRTALTAMLSLALGVCLAALLTTGGGESTRSGSGPAGPPAPACEGPR
ncbi:hypothetical protein [Nonomuraea rosea]